MKDFSPKHWNRPQNERSEEKLSSEVVGIFSEIDALLASGRWKFVGNIYTRKGIYEIRLQEQGASGVGEKPGQKVFISPVAYDRIVFADGRTDPPLEKPRL